MSFDKYLLSSTTSRLDCYFTIESYLFIYLYNCRFYFLPSYLFKSRLNLSRQVSQFEFLLESKYKYNQTNIHHQYHIISLISVWQISLSESFSNCVARDITSKKFESELKISKGKDSHNFNEIFSAQMLAIAVQCNTIKFIAVFDSKVFEKSRIE